MPANARTRGPAPYQNFLVGRYSLSNHCPKVLTKSVQYNSQKAGFRQTNRQTNRVVNYNIDVREECI